MIVLHSFAKNVNENLRGKKKKNMLIYCFSAKAADSGSIVYLPRGLNKEVGLAGCPFGVLKSLSWAPGAHPSSEHMCRRARMFTKPAVLQTY